MSGLLGCLLRKIAVYATVFFTCVNAGYAGGPLSLFSNAPVVYPNGGTNIVLNYDRGDLGSRDNATADALVNQSIALWNSVNTSTLNMTQGSDIPVDVIASNYSTYANDFSDGINPVIYDDDGSIIDSVLGAGMKNSVLGFAGSAFFTSGPDAGKFAEGRAVINGFFSMSDNTLVVVMAHEMGHFIGMDHSQLDNTQGLASSNYVLMYPQAFRTLTSLHDDDIQAVTGLYPATNKDTNFGTITGDFQNADTSAKLGVNVWVQETNSGKVYSCVSDYLLNGDGAFSILVPPGTYTMHAEPIQSGFTGGSSVGPHSETSGDASFVNPITPVDFEESGSTPFEFTVTAGCTRDITFLADGSGTVNTSCGTPPTANDDTLSVTEDTPANGTLTGSPASAGTLSYSIVSNGSKGTAVITNAATGAYTYTPDLNETGSDSFTFRVTEDGSEISAPATISVTINGANDAPVASNSNITVTQGLFATDTASATDIDGDSLTYSISVQPTKGIVSIDSNTGEFTYTSNADAGADSFTFQVDDGNGSTDTGVVSVTIDANPLVAITPDLSSPRGQGAAITFTAAANSSGSFEYTYYFNGPSSNNQWIIVKPRSAVDTWTWNTGAADVGENRIQVQANAANGSTYAFNIISYTVAEQNNPPVAVGDTLIVTENASVSADLSASDIDGDSLIYSITVQPTLGSIAFSALKGSYTYTSTGGTGADSFTYQVSDGNGGTDTAVVNITVNPPAANQAPVASDASISLVVNESASGTVSATDPDGNPLTYSVTVQPSLGTISMNASNGSYTYVSTGATGNDSFTYQVSDGQGGTDTGVVSVTVLSVASVSISADIASPGNVNTAITFTAAANGVGPFEYVYYLNGPGTGNSWRIVKPRSATTSWSWVPSVEDIGTSNLQVQVFSASGQVFAFTTASYDVAQQNNAPVASDGVLSVTENATTSGTVVASDPDGDALSFSVTVQPTLGTVSMSSSGSYTYTSTGGQGADSFTFSASDGNGGTDTGVVNISVNAPAPNNAPVANDGILTVVTLQSAADTVTASDADGDSLSYSVSVPPASGTVSMDPVSGDYTYTSSGAAGMDSFTFAVSDGNGGVDTGTVNITVIAGPDVSITPDVASPQTQGGSISFTAAANASGPFQYAFFFNGPGTGNTWRVVKSRSDDDAWTWEPDSDDIGDSQLQVQAFDVNGALYATTTILYTIQ